MIKGKVADVLEEAGSGSISVVAENAVTGEKITQTVDMVVLATGMQPTAANIRLPADLKMTEDGFMINDFDKGGMFATGCANKPSDVVSSNQNATGIALKAIQTLVKR
jgi:quinone-modifying oxidoreductase subunit QmoA